MYAAMDTLDQPLFGQDVEVAANGRRAGVEETDGVINGQPATNKSLTTCPNIAG